MSRERRQKVLCFHFEQVIARGQKAGILEVSQMDSVTRLDRRRLCSNAETSGSFAGRELAQAAPVARKLLNNSSTTRG